MTRRPGAARSRLRPVPAAAPRRPLPDLLAALGATATDAVVDRVADGADAVARDLRRRAALPRGAGLPAPAVAPDRLRAGLDARRGTDLAALAAVADGLRAAAAGLRGRHRRLADEAGTLWTSWAGPAADDVADRVVALARAAHGVVGTLEEVADGVEELVRAEVAAVRAATDAVRAAVPPGDPTADPAPDRRAQRADAAEVDERTTRLLAALTAAEATVTAARAALAARCRTPDARGPAGADDAGPVPTVEALLADLLGRGLAGPESVAPVGSPAGQPTRVSSTDDASSEVVTSVPLTLPSDSDA